MWDLLFIAILGSMIILEHIRAEKWGARYKELEKIIQMHQCSSKLGISRNDRLKLKLLEAKEKDEFDLDFK